MGYILYIYVRHELNKTETTKMTAVNSTQSARNQVNFFSKGVDTQEQKNNKKQIKLFEEKPAEVAATLASAKSEPVTSPIVETAGPIASNSTSSSTSSFCAMA